MGTKELIINNIVYAKYEIEGDLIYIKKLVNIIPDKEMESEDLLIHIISLIEKVQFSKAAYLNV